MAPRPAAKRINVYETMVLGAGMVGVSIAHHLAESGRSVVLVDRREPGRETSFGNAGLIQREAVQPHPFPRDFASMARVLPNRQIDIRYRMRAMLSNAEPLLDYWRNSAPDRLDRITDEYASLIVHCTSEHAHMMDVAGAQDLVRKDGWLDVFRSEDAFDEHKQLAADFARRFGVEYELLDRAALARVEPGLSEQVIGAVHWTNSWSVVDPGALVQAYAASFERLGGEIRQTEVTDIEQVSGNWRLITHDQTIEAENLVLATGPWSKRWLRALGYRMPLFFMRGYHMHYAPGERGTLNHAFMDHEKGYLMSPKRAGLRLTTGAELNTLDATPRSSQLDAAEAEARTIFPLGERRDPQPWKGARPCMSDMKPVIGPAPQHDKLWFAFGHGHQGFTLGPITGRVVTQMMSQQTPSVDMRPFRADRF